MVSLTTAVDRTDGVTLVSLHVENPHRERRVRIVNRLDGPLWPPRRQGRPAEGWDEHGFEGVVAADSSLALGYASPAPPSDPPAELETVAPVSDRDAADPDADLETPTGVVRSLGDPVVPRHAVPVDTSPEARGAAPQSNGRPRDASAPDTSNRSRPDTSNRGSNRSGTVTSNRDSNRETRSMSDRLAAIEQRLASLESK